MKVVLAAPHWETGQWGYYCHRALEQLGHVVIRLEYGRVLAQPLPMVERLRRRLLHEPTFSLDRLLRVQHQANLRLLTTCTRERPDVLLLLRGDVYLPETIHAVTARLRIPVLNWCGDDPAWFPNILGSLRLYTRFCIVDPSYLPLARQMGACEPAYLPHAADPDVYRPYPLSPAERDSFACEVIFVGDSRHRMGHLPENWYRVEMVEAVARLGVRLRVYGKGWETLDESYQVRQAVAGRALLPAERVARAYQAAHIVLNVHHPQLPQGCNQRTFEAPACGAFSLVDDRAELHRLFAVEEEIAAYRDTEDLAAQIRHYLAHAAERERIAARGRQRVLDEHTYVHRLRWLLERGMP